jgi:hypothetical protein
VVDVAARMLGLERKLTSAQARAVGATTLVEVAVQGDVVVGVAGVDVAALETAGARERHGDDDGDASMAVVEDDDAEVDAVRAVKDEVRQ